MMQALKTANKDMREVFIQAAISFVIKTSGAGFGFFANVLLARQLGAVGAGQYFLAVGVISIAMVIARLGLDNIILKKIAALSAQSDQEGVHLVYRDTLKISLGAAILSSIVLAITAPWLATALFRDPLLADLLRWMSLSIVPSVMVVVQAQALQGIHKIRQSMTVSSLLTPCLNLLGVVILVPVFQVKGAAFATVLSATLNGFVGILYWRTLSPKIDLPLTKHFSGWWLLVKEAMPLYLNSLLVAVNTYFPTVLLGVWASKTEIGLFGVALKVATLVSFILVSVNSVAAPKFSVMYATRDIQGLAKIAKGTTRLMIIVASPFLLFCLIWPELLLSVFGGEFKQAANLLRVLAVGEAVNVASGSVGYLLMMTNHQKLLLYLGVATTILVLVLSVSLMPYFGALGAALSLAAGVIVSNLLGMYFVWRKLHFITIG